MIVNGILFDVMQPLSSMYSRDFDGVSHDDKNGGLRKIWFCFLNVFDAIFVMYSFRRTPKGNIFVNIFTSKFGHFC